MALVAALQVLARDGQERGTPAFGELVEAQVIERVPQVLRERQRFDTAESRSKSMPARR